MWQTGVGMEHMVVVGDTAIVVGRTVAGLWLVWTKALVVTTVMAVGLVFVPQEV